MDPRRLLAPLLVASASAVVTLAELQTAASRAGYRLEPTGAGPFYRINLYDAAAVPSARGGAEGSLLGYSDGFTQPTGVAHLESIQVRRFTGYWNRANRRAKAAGEHRELGLLITVAVFCWIRERSPLLCESAQLLAILDETKQHAILTRYYRTLGFSKVRDVGDGVRSLADQLAWGGCGTLMQIGVDDFLERNGGRALALCSAREGQSEVEPPRRR